MVSIPPPHEKILRQIAAYPHYDVLRNIKNIPEGIDTSNLFEMACYLEKNFKKLLFNTKKIQYIDFIKIYHQDNFNKITVFMI